MREAIWLLGSPFASGWCPVCGTLASMTVVCGVAVFRRDRRRVSSCERRFWWMKRQRLACWANCVRLRCCTELNTAWWLELFTRIAATHVHRLVSRNFVSHQRPFRGQIATLFLFLWENNSLLAGHGF
jgi:hypothetical protein